MWQQVTADNPSLVQTAFDVLSVYDDGWRNVADFTKWLEGKFVYYLHGPDYELVLGFRRRKGEKQWRIATGSVRGNLSQAAIEQGVEKMVDFMKSKRTKALHAKTWKRDPSDPIEAIYRMIRDVARRHPDMKNVSEDDVAEDKQWGLFRK